MDLEDELLRRGGVASRVVLLEAGATPRMLTKAVSEGAIVRGRRGWYASARLPQPALTAFRFGGRLAATDAARSYGLWVLRSRQMHVWVPPAASRLVAPPPGVRLHWDPA